MTDTNISPAAIFAHTQILVAFIARGNRADQWKPVLDEVLPKRKRADWQKGKAKQTGGAATAAAAQQGGGHAQQNDGDQQQQKKQHEEQQGQQQQQQEMPQSTGGHKEEAQPKRKAENEASDRDPESQDVKRQHVS